LATQIRHSEALAGGDANFTASTIGLGGDDKIFSGLALLPRIFGRRVLFGYGIHPSPLAKQRRGTSQVRSDRTKRFAMVTPS